MAKFYNLYIYFVVVIAIAYVSKKSATIEITNQKI